MQYLRPTSGGPVMWGGRRANYMGDVEFVLPVALTVTPEKVKDWQAAVAWLRKWTMGGMRDQAGRDLNWVIIVRYGTVGKWRDLIGATLRREHVRASVVSAQGGERSVEQIAAEHVQDKVLWLPEEERARLAGIATINVPWGMAPYCYLGRRIAKVVMGPAWHQAEKRRQWLLRAARSVGYRLSESALHARSGGDLGATMVSPVNYCDEPETILDHLRHDGNWWPHGTEGSYGEADIDDPMAMWPTPGGPPDDRTKIKTVDWQAIKDRFQLPDRRDEEKGEPTTQAVNPDRV